MSQGFIRLARELIEDEIWTQGPDYVRMWIYLLLSARWSDKPAHKGPVTIGYGQMLRTYRTIADDCEWAHNRRVKRWSTSQVKRMLDWLEEQGSITTLGTELGTLITVRKFKQYQDLQTYQRELGTELGTTLEQPRNSKKKVEEGEEGVPPSPYSPSPPTVGDYDEAFEAFWETYPRYPNRNKKRTHRKWVANLRKGVSPEDMTAGAQRYADYVAETSTPERYVKHAATFLGPDEHWRLPWEVPESERQEDEDARQAARRRQYERRETERRITEQQEHDKEAEEDMSELWAWWEDLGDEDRARIKAEANRRARDMPEPLQRPILIGVIQEHRREASESAA